MNRFNTNLVVFALSLAGALISLFLTVKYIQHADIPCGSGEDSCNQVASSAAAHGLGIPALEAVPTPAFGVLMYVTLAGLSFVRTLTPSESVRRTAGRTQWGIAAAGVAVSAWLTWQEGAVIHAWCRWCLASAAIITLIFLTATVEHLARQPRARGEVLQES